MTNTFDKIAVYVNDFLPEPHKVRNEVLKVPLEVCTRGNYAGRRSIIYNNQLCYVDNLVFDFLRANNIKIEDYKYQKYITIATENDLYRSWMHTDIAQYHVLIYLSPYEDDKLFVGTKKHKDATTFNLDDFDIVKEIDMKFNTCILLDTSYFHAPKKGKFGSNNETGRCVLMYSFGKKDIPFDEKEYPIYDGNIVNQYCLDISKDVDTSNIQQLLPYLSMVVEKYCMPVYYAFFNTVEKASIYNHTNYCKLYTETYNLYDQTYNWCDIKLNMNEEKGPTWIILFIRKAAKKGGICKIADISSNKIHTFIPIDNKFIIFPAAWPWRYSFSFIEEGIQIVDVIKVNSY